MSVSVCVCLCVSVCVRMCLAVPGLPYKPYWLFVGTDASD